MLWIVRKQLYHQRNDETVQRYHWYHWSAGRDHLSNRLTSRLDIHRQTWRRRRMVTVFAGISLPRTDVISLSYSSAS